MCSMGITRSRGMRSVGNFSACYQGSRGTGQYGSWHASTARSMFNDAKGLRFISREGGPDVSCTSAPFREMGSSRWPRRQGRVRIVKVRRTPPRQRTHQASDLVAYARQRISVNARSTGRSRWMFRRPAICARVFFNVRGIANERQRTGDGPDVDPSCSVLSATAGPATSIHGRTLTLESRQALLENGTT